MTSEKRSNQVQLWIAIIAGVTTVVAAVITVWPQIVPGTSAEPRNPDVVDEQIDVYDPTAEPLTLGDDVEQSEVSSIEAEITEVLHQAYDLKASSLRYVDTTGLEDVYTADALDYRIHAVEVTKESGCYWDIKLDQPEEYEMEHVAETGARVMAMRVETRFHYCNDELNTDYTMVGDRYFVRYFLQKKDGRWLVYDAETVDLPD
jgi:hypothetical protein